MARLIRVEIGLNSREIAMVAWTGLVLTWALRRGELRQSLLSVARTALQPVILLPILAFLAYIAGWAWIGMRVDAWSWSLINGTVWWFLATGSLLLFGATQVAEVDDFFIRTAKRH